jgi:lactoylglutathione lyase
MGGRHGFAFVKIQVKDLDAHIAFYGSVLNLQPAHRMSGPAGDQVFLAGVNEGPSLVLVHHHAASVSRGGAVLGFRVADLDATVRAALTAGGEARVLPKPIPGGGLRVAVVADPEGHALELLEDV